MMCLVIAITTATFEATEAPALVVFPTVPVASVKQYYFDQLNFITDRHDYIAVTHNRNYATADVLKMNLQKFSLQFESNDM